MLGERPSLKNTASLPQPFEHCSLQKRMFQGNNSYMRLLQRTSGYKTKEPVGLSNETAWLMEWD